MDEGFVVAHKGAGDGGTPIPRTHGVSVHVSFVTHPVHPLFPVDIHDHGVSESLDHHPDTALGSL